MKIFENIRIKFHSQKGITGADVAVAILIIAVTIGLITGIYINITNGSKENIRYSAATRIATQIVENIEAMSYDEVASTKTLKINANTAANVERKIFNVTVPRGYAVTVTAYNITAEVNVIKKYNVEVSYKVGKNSNDSINLQIIKQRELLEQTNRPDLNLLPNYGNSSKYFYPIKYVQNKYVVTTIDDKDWYNYDSGYYANIYVTNVKKEIGDIVTPSNSERYVWIPRFGRTDNKTLTSSNITFLYGTSKHRIVFKNIDVSKKFYSYTVDYTNGSYNDATSYVENTFSDNDGLIGMWYLMSGTSNAVNVKNAYNALTGIYILKN